MILEFVLGIILACVAIILTRWIIKIFFFKQEANTFDNVFQVVLVILAVAWTVALCLWIK